MKKITYTLLLLVLLGSLESFGQGQVSRPAKSQTTKPKVQKVASQIKISDPDGFINGHGYVDLGLTSGIKWATCNVGASMPSEFGDYYAWGETKPKSSYKWHNYFDCIDIFSQECGIYKFRGKTQISPSSGHDAARENWGNTWRMPTGAELEELNTKCKWKWTEKDGHNGYIIIGPNGKSIFIPAAGWRRNEDFIGAGKTGTYWSTSLGIQHSNGGALHLILRDGYHEVYNSVRSEGLSVRSVTE